MNFSLIAAFIFQHLGPFKFPMFLILIIVLALIVMLFFESFVRKGSNVERRKQAMNALLVLGSMNLAVGMLGQIMGIWYALAAILEADDISPAIVTEGLRASFGTTYFGFITFFIAVIGWLIFNYLPVRKTADENKTG